MRNNKKQLNIKSFMMNLIDLNYVLIKKPDYFPEYYPGSDLDIICDNKKILIQRLLIEGNKYILESNYEIRVSSNEEMKHTKVDFYLDDKIELRFDVHEGLPRFTKVQIRSDYIYPLLENKQKIDSVNVPSHIDELILRYIEYFEWFHKRPDKIKHLEYIEKYLKNGDERKKFFDRLHKYVKILNKEEIEKAKHNFEKSSLSHTDFRTKMKRELRYRTPLLYKTLIKIKRFVSKGK